MSYILEALKKSDRERKQGKVPTLETMPEPAEPQRSRKKARWPFALLGILILGGITWFAVRFFHPVTTPLSLAPPQATAPASVSRPVPPPPLNATPPSPAPTETPKAAPTAVPAPDAAAKPADASIPASAKPEIKEGTGQAENPAPAPPAATPFPGEETAGPVTASEPPETAIPGETVPGDRAAMVVPPDVESSADASGNTGELPDDIKSRLPDIKIGVLFYSKDPAARRASVNGRLLKEGDQAGPGLYLNEITPDGAIFSYHGRKFRVPVFPF